MAHNSDKSEAIFKLEAGGFLWEVFLAVALPAGICAYAGRRLDAAWGTHPWMTLLGLLLALGLSGVIVSRQALRFAQRLKTTKPPTT